MLDLVLSMNSWKKRVKLVLSDDSVKENAISYPISVFCGRKCYIVSYLCILWKKMLHLILSQYSVVENAISCSICV